MGISVLISAGWYHSFVAVSQIARQPSQAKQEMDAIKNDVVFFDNGAKIEEDVAYRRQVGCLKTKYRHGITIPPLIDRPFE
ncbi:hypothetical protein [Methylocystis sp. ATCC 49242]|uniref:hypothetical protein n=1 Tax=Methylocystis sp. ATCC 49242 TaxID=622637 RepID=UPI001186A775|nr:hypothetical protein [Methylocystis sp. ATCC 49242]